MKRPLASPSPRVGGQRRSTAAQRALLATASACIAECWRPMQCMVVGLLSRAHRCSLVSAGRSTSRLSVGDVVGCVGDLEDALAVAPSLGLGPSPLLCEAAARAGHVDVLVRAQTLGCVLEGTRCYLAAMDHNRVSILVYLEQHVYYILAWDAKLCARAAARGALDVLKFLRSESRPHGPCPWDGETCKQAAVHGHRALLAWVRSLGPGRACPWGCDLAAELASRGDLAMLMFVRKVLKPAAPWDVLTTELAAAAGKWFVVQWARKEGCPWSQEVKDMAIQYLRDDAPSNS